MLFLSFLNRVDQTFRVAIPSLIALSVAVCIGCATPASHGSPSKQAAQTSMQNVQSLIAQNKLDEAEAALVKIVSDNPKAGGAWLQLGLVRQMTKKYDLALEAYTKATEFPNAKPLALYNSACVYSLTGKVGEAIEKLTEATAAGFKDREQFYVDTDLDGLRKDPRFEKLMPPLLEGNALFAEPTRILYVLSGENPGDEFGWSGRKVGDVDGDKVIDFAITSPSYQNGAGKVYVYSGKKGNLLYSFTGKAGQRAGNIATAGGDINADGVPDILIGAPNGRIGSVIALSGKNGSVLRTLNGEQVGASFGYKTCCIGDLDNDGNDDIVVTEPRGSGAARISGRCHGYSGKDGTLLFTIDGEASADQFGVAVVCDYTTKRRILAIGAQDAGEGDKGRVYVYTFEGTKPILKYTLDADANGRDFGQMFLSYPGDYDKDGALDLYAADFNSSAKVPGGGQVFVYSTGTGKKIFQIDGSRPGEGLGTSPSDAGDCNGDGIGDLIVGAWQNNEGGRSAGKVYLFSGADQKTLAAWTCKMPADTFGFDATGIGDVDGDGAIDFLLTSAWSPVKGKNTGRAFVIAGPKLKS